MGMFHDIVDFQQFQHMSGGANVEANVEANAPEPDPFDAILGVSTEDILHFYKTAPPPPNVGANVGANVEANVDDGAYVGGMDPKVLDAFVDMSLRNHSLTMKKLIGGKDADARILRKLYKSFVDNLSDREVIARLARMERSYASRS